MVYPAVGFVRCKTLSQLYHLLAIRQRQRVVGDDEQGLVGAFYAGEEGGEEALRGGGIEAGRGLVEDDDGAGLQQSTGEAEAMALALGEGEAAGAERSVEALWEETVPVGEGGLIQGREAMLIGDGLRELGVESEEFKHRAVFEGALRRAKVSTISIAKV